MSHSWSGLVLAALVALSFLFPPNIVRSEDAAPPAVVVWQGEVEVNESLVFSANQTLVIRPGTSVLIRTVAPSCTDGSAPVITVAGNLVADGNETARIRFTSVTADGAVCTAGREAVLIYSGSPARNQSLSYADFTGGSVVGYRTALSLRHCTFNQTQVRFSGGSSTVQNSAFLNSPLSVFPSSAIVIANNTFSRDAPDEAGIYLYDGATVRDNTITNCVSGIEASIWITGTITGNNITGCLEAINSTGALDISENDLTGNGVGIRSWAGLDRLSGNLLAGNDVGVVSLGRVSGAENNIFSAPGVAANRLADIQEMVLASGGCVDGNGQPLAAPVTIKDSAGRTVFSGDPEFVPLTAYEKLANGTERSYTPFSAQASLAGISNSTTLVGNYSVSFSIRLGLYPELSVQAFRGAFSGAPAGGQVPMTIQVRNTGKVAARNFRVAAFVDGQPAFVQHVNSLNPGDARNLTFEWTASAGAHTFRALADSNGTVAELSEKDNSRTFRAEVRSSSEIQPGTMILPTFLMILVGIVILLLRTPRV
jgi:hypothetical protein